MTRKSTRLRPPMKQQVAAKTAPHKPARSTRGVTKPCRYRRPGIAAPRRMGNIMEHGAKVTCYSRPNCIKDYARELDGIYLKLLEESCFGHLIHLPSLSFCSNVVHNVLLRIKDTPKKDKEEEEEDAMSFIIGNQEIHFGEREFAMMSGLKFQGSEEIDQNPKRIPLMEAHFPGQDTVKFEDLVEKFYQLQNSEDKLKLALLLIAEGVITGRGLHRSFNKGHFLLVDNLEEFNSYPWGKLSYKETISSLIRASKLKHVSNAKHTRNKMVYHLYGFPHVFQAWIFYSIPSLKQAYTFENKDCSQTLYPRMLHLEVPKIQVTLHKKIQKELSRLDIKVLSPLHPTQEELKQCYMAGLLSEGEDLGVRGHGSVSGIKEMNGEAEANAQWEANHYSSPTNSSPLIGCTNSTKTSNNCSRKQKKKQKSNSHLLKVDKKIGTTSKEYITLSNDEDEDVESLESLKLKLRSEIEILKKERSAVEENAILNKEKLQSDFDILNQETAKVESDLRLHCEQQKKLQCGFEILFKEMTKLVSDTELLNKEKTTVESDIQLLNKKKTTLGNDIEFLSLEKAELEPGYEFLKDEKDKLQNEVELLNEEKDKLQSDVELLAEEKVKLGADTELLSKEKTKLQSDFECLSREKSTMESHIELLNKKKTTLRNDIELLSLEKSEMETSFQYLKDENNKLCGGIVILNREKILLGNGIELLNKEKTKMYSDTESLNNDKNILEADIRLLNGRKTTVQHDICSLNEKKTTVQDDIWLLNEKKTKVQDDICSLYEKKTLVHEEKAKLGMDVVLLKKRKCEVETDLELSNKEKDKLQNEVELLNNEKVKLQSDIEFFKGEKAEFILSVTADVSKSFSEREKTLVENEKMFIELKEMNQTLVAKERCYTEELREACQELIKVMVSEKVTRNTVIGVKKRKRGDPELWNFREQKRATLKEVISFQLNRTDK